MEDGYRKVGLVIDWNAKFQDVAFAMQAIYNSNSNFNAMDVMHKIKFVVVYAEDHRFFIERAIEQFPQVFQEVDWDCEEPAPSEFSYESPDY